MTDRLSAFRNARYFPTLDGLRALAVLLVVGFHANVPGDRVFAHGSYGVQVFFAISGLLITTLLLREGRAGTIDLAGFYRRRTARIFPLYYAVLATYCVLVWRTEHGPDADAFWHNLPAFLTYTTNWVVDHRADGGRVIFLFAWSLAVEEQFYLVWPSVVRWIRGLAPIVALAAAVVHPYFTAIGLGCILALALESDRFGPSVGRLLGSRWALPISGLAVITVLANRDLLGVWGESLVATLLVGAAVLRPDHPFSRALAWRPARYVGGISYGIYMMHQLALNAVRRAHVGGYLLPLLAAGVTIVAASVSFYLYERPIMRWAKQRGALKPVAHQLISADARPSAITDPAPVS